MCGLKHIICHAVIMCRNQFILPFTFVMFLVMHVSYRTCFLSIKFYAGVLCIERDIYFGIQIETEYIFVMYIQCIDVKYFVTFLSVIMKAK